MKRNKFTKLLLILPLLLLPSCSTKKEEYICNNEKYKNYEFDYFFGRYGEIFSFNLNNFFKEGKLVTEKNEIFEISEKYTHIEIYFYLGNEGLNVGLDKQYRYKYEIENCSNIEMIYPSLNCELFIRFINENEKICSKLNGIAYIYIWREDYELINSFDDIANMANICYGKTFVLNNDIDFADYNENWKSKYLNNATILNPNNYRIKYSKRINLNQNDYFSLFRTMEFVYIDNLIFDDIYIVNEKNEFLDISISLLCNSSINSVIKNCKINNLSINANNYEISGLLNNSKNTAFINNEINLNINQFDDLKYKNEKVVQKIGGLGIDNKKVGYGVAGNEIYDGEYTTYKRFPCLYNKVTGSLNGVGLVGGLFATEYYKDFCRYDYNIVNAELKSSINIVGEISAEKYE